jgi:hypothetical protein
MLAEIPNKAYSLMTNSRFWIILLAIIFFLFLAGYVYNTYVASMINKDFIAKLAGGMWGQKVTQIELDETKNTVHNKKEATDIEITKFSLSKNLYDTEVSLFSPESLVQEEIIMNMKFRLFNTNLNVEGVVAIPGIGCGMTVNVEQGRGQISSTKTDGYYIVSDINHTYIMEDGKMQYSQNIGLVREGNK